MEGSGRDRMWWDVWRGPGRTRTSVGQQGHCSGCIRAPGERGRGGPMQAHHGWLDIRWGGVRVGLRKQRSPSPGTPRGPGRAAASAPALSM